jgi:hypothetical protein
LATPNIPATIARTRSLALLRFQKAWDVPQVWCDEWLSLIVTSSDLAGTNNRDLLANG